MRRMSPVLQGYVAVRSHEYCHRMKQMKLTKNSQFLDRNLSNLILQFSNQA